MVKRNWSRTCWIQFTSSGIYILNCVSTEPWLTTSHLPRMNAWHSESLHLFGTHSSAPTFHLYSLLRTRILLGGRRSNSWAASHEISLRRYGRNLLPHDSSHDDHVLQFNTKTCQRVKLQAHERSLIKRIHSRCVRSHSSGCVWFLSTWSKSWRSFAVQLFCFLCHVVRCSLCC